MQFLNTILFQHLIKWDLTATERKQFGSLYLSTVSQNEVQGTPASEPPKVLAGFQGPISTSCFRASGPRAQEYEWVIIVQTCVWQAAALSNFFPDKGGCKLLYAKHLMWGSSISENLRGPHFPPCWACLLSWCLQFLSCCVPQTWPSSPPLILWLTCVPDLTTASYLDAFFLCNPPVCPWETLSNTVPARPGSNSYNPRLVQHLVPMIRARIWISVNWSKSPACPSPKHCSSDSGESISGFITYYLWPWASYFSSPFTIVPSS